MKTNEGYGPLPTQAPGPVPPLSKAQGRVLAVLQAHRDAQRGPMTMNELAMATGLHPNTLREHLESLIRTGRVRRHQAPPSGPGRPHTLYEAVRTQPDGRSEYAGLAGALAATIHRTSDDPGRDAIEAGDLWGRELATEHGGPHEPGEVGARQRVLALLDDIGFAPEADEPATSARLTRCPLLAAAERFPDVVCAVHLGIVRGALDEYGADPSAADLLPFSEPGACRLHLAHGSVGGRQ